MGTNRGSEPQYGSEGQQYGIEGEDDGNDMGSRKKRKKYNNQP